MKREGWDGVAPLGIKTGYRHANGVKRMGADTMVAVARPLHEIVKSRRRAGFGASDLTAHSQLASCRRVFDAWDDRKYWIWTPDLASGHLGELRDFASLYGLTWNEDAVREWIDPDLWGA